MNWKQNISLVSFFLLPVIFFFGIFLWLFLPSIQQSKSDSFLQKVPLQPWHELIPNLKKAQVFVLDRPHDPEELQKPDDLYQSNRIRTFYISTNDLGLRNKSISQKKHFRILCVGESVTFGWGVDAEKSYPYQLEQILGIEVINAGVPSARIEQSKAWLEEHSKTMDPDLVLLTYRPDWNQRNAINNFSAAIREIQRTIHPTPLGLILSPISSFDQKGMQYAEQESKELPTQMRNVPILDLSPIFRQQKTEFGVRLTIQNNIQKLIDVNNGSILFESLDTDKTSETSHLSPDLIQIFENNIKLHEPLIFDGGHPDEQGYLLMAQSVAKWIQQNRWYTPKNK